MAENPRVFGKYDVIRRLAVGGMGEIFLARQTGMAGFERLVILKSLLPQLASEDDQLAQFLDEARIVGSINHPNVVACYEVGEWEGVYFIAMEYINGVDVASLAKAGDDAAQRFPVNVAMTITREAALGLDSAHQATDPQGRALKIVHRDISPHNVMVRYDGLTKIVDFGVAMAANRQNKRTEGGLLKGKLGYMAPEQIKAQPLDGRADQFSLGVLLWELLTGRRLFTADDPSAVFMKIIREKVPPPSSVMPDVPPGLDAVVLKMTAQEPADRYGRLAEVAAALRKLLDQRAAQEQETADLVRDLVGAKLAARLRDLTPAPVNILGVHGNRAQHSASFCRTCGAQAVSGDRFCRNCGTPIEGRKAPSSATGPYPPVAEPAPPPTPSPEPSAAPPADLDDAFELEAGDAIDIAFDDSSGTTESAVLVGVLELVDSAGTHPPPPSMIRPVAAHLDELATRLGGELTVEGARLVATFMGNARAARGALAYARRARLTVSRSARELRLRGGISATAGGAHGDTTARDEAEAIVGRARPGSLWIAERARRLASVALPWGATLHVPGVDGATIDALEVPSLPRVAGRATERLAIEQCIAAANVGSGQQLLVIGDAGMGKSTLLELAAAEARDRGFVVGHARCGRCAALLHHDAVRQVITSASKELLATLGRAGPWHEALGALAMSEPDRARLRSFVDDEGAAADDAVPLPRRRLLLRAAIIAFFRHLVDSRGVCVVLDDIHAADVPSLDLFAEVGARLGEARYLLFAASRPARGERVLPLARRAVLGPMEPKDLHAVASQAIGGQLPNSALAHVAARVGGNPLFASLLARHLVRVHLVRVVGDDAVASDDLPRFPTPPTLGVLSFATHALLPDDGRRLLQAAAPLGQVVDAELLAHSVGAASVDDVRSALLALAGAGALVFDEATDEVTFPTMTERELVAARVDLNAAGAQHQRLWTWLNGLAEPQRTPRHDALVAHLAAVLGDHQHAAAAAERVAMQAQRHGATDAMAERFREALHARWRLLHREPVTEEQARRALDVAGRATALIGEADPAAAVDLALPFLRRLPATLAVAERVEAERARAVLLLRLRKTDEAQRVLDDALERNAHTVGPALQGSLLVDIAAALEQAGQPEAARVQLGEALRVLGQLPREQRGRALDALLALVRSHLKARDLAAARELLLQARDEAERRNSAAARIDVVSMDAALQQAEGNMDGAIQALQQALAIAESVGDEAAEARIRQQQVRALQQCGRVQDALAAARAARTVALRIAWDEGISVAEQMVRSLEVR